MPDRFQSYQCLAAAKACLLFKSGLDGLGLDPGDQRAQRQLDVTRRALAIPTAQATDGDAEFPGEIEIGQIKAGPREADETVGHGKDRAMNGFIIVGSSIAFKRRFDAWSAPGCAQPAAGQGRDGPLSALTSRPPW
jgi:hypothetical protein